MPRPPPSPSTQSVAPTPGQPDKETLHIPLALGLLARPATTCRPLAGEEAATPAPTTRVLEVTENRQSFTFSGVAAPPTPSLLRGFSAPVRLTNARDSADLAFLMAHDSDPVARWDAGQALALQVLTDKAQGRPAAEAALIERLALCWPISGWTRLRARAIALPSMVEIGDALPVYDVPAVFHARRDLAQQGMGRLCGAVWTSTRPWAAPMTATT